MGRSALVLGTLFVVVAIGAYFLLPTAPIKNYPSAGTDVIAFGDSLVYGQGASEGKSFVPLLSQAIGRPIINLGVPGDTTAQGLARINELDKYKPQVVLLLLGGNDYLKRVPQEETFANLAKIIADIQSRGAVVILLGVRGGLLNDHFDEEFQKLADTYHTAYVPDVLDGLLGEKQYMSDQVHPNDAGYAIIAARIAPVLKKLLQ